MAPWENGFEKSALLSGRVPKFFASAVSGGAHDAGRVLGGYRRAAEHGGPESFIAALPGALIGKVFGPKASKKYDKFMWKHVSRPALMADTALGRVLEKTPIVGKMFRQKEQIPWGKDLHRTVERSSALAPLVKARNIAVPIVAGVGIDKAIRSVSKKDLDSSNRPSKGDNMNSSEIQKMASHLGDAHLREKVASTMLRLNEVNKEHEKRAQAVKFLYKKAEMGLEALPPTYEAFQEKVASLIRQDLAVLEKALELAAGDVKIGELSGSDPLSRDAAATFQATVLGL